MFALIQWTKEKKPRMGETEVLRVRFCTVPLKRGGPSFLMRRRCRRAARQLVRLGITRAVFPADFAWVGEFAAEDVLPADPLPLYRALAAELVQAVMARRGSDERGVPVAVCADRLTAEVRQAVTALCIRNRYVVLSAPDREGAFCRQLRREYGAPVVQAEGAEQLDRAGVVVLFSARAGLFRDQTVLELYDGGTLPPWQILPEEDDCLPEGCDRRQLMGALWAAGALRPGQLRVVPEKPEEQA